MHQILLLPLIPVLHLTATIPAGGYTPLGDIGYLWGRDSRHLPP